MINRSNIKYILLMLVITISFQMRMAISANSIPLPSSDELGTVCYSNGKSKPITPSDVLWIAKMVDGETWGKATEEDAKSMFWSIIQRSNKNSIFRKWTLKKLVREYSQPLNKKWLKNGIRCKEYYNPEYTGPKKGNCTPKKVKKRAKNIKKKWTKLKPLLRSWVVDFSKGNGENAMPGVIGWFGKKQWDKQEKDSSNQNQKKRVFFKEIGKNVFYKRSKPDTTKWTSETVRVISADESC